LVACATLLAALFSAEPSLAAKPPMKEKTIDVQLLAINDFHGNCSRPPAPRVASPRPRDRSTPAVSSSCPRT
jgi:hypothetical protein